MVTSPLDTLIVSSGVYFEFIIPENTFIDLQDGNTRNLTLSLLDINGQVVLRSLLIFVKGMKTVETLFRAQSLSPTLKSIARSNTHRSRWCNGLACLQQWLCYLQGPGFESHLRQVEFFACNKVSPLNR